MGTPMRLNKLFIIYYTFIFGQLKLVKYSANDQMVLIFRMFLSFPLSVFIFSMVMTRL